MAMRRLVEAIPKEKWYVRPGLATASLPPIIVRVWHAEGGSGINTYTKVHVVVEREDLSVRVPPLFVGTFTDDELKILNFIPKVARLPASHTA